MRDRKALRQKQLAMVGRRFGSLRVVLVWVARARAYRNHYRAACVCDCGTYFHSSALPVLDGLTISCGCASRRAQLNASSVCVQRMLREREAAAEHRKASVAALDAMPRPLRPPGR